jgi:hypothetical protein
MRKYRKPEITSSSPEALNGRLRGFLFQFSKKRKGETAEERSFK